VREIAAFAYVLGTIEVRGLKARFTLRVFAFPLLIAITEYWQTLLVISDFVCLQGNLSGRQDLCVQRRAMRRSIDGFYFEKCSILCEFALQTFLGTSTTTWSLAISSPGYKVEYRPPRPNFIALDMQFPASPTRFAPSLVLTRHGGRSDVRCRGCLVA
jgi:hypothetical protein